MKDIKVKKRNGKLQDFNSEKIYAAIMGAVNDVGRPINEDIIKRIVKDIVEYVNTLDKEFITIEEIQDLVENKLMNSSLKDIARQYIRYRYKRELLRKQNTTDESIIELLAGNNDYWNRENSNKNAKLTTTVRDYVAGITSTDIARRVLLPKDVVEAHDAGIIHIHDMDYILTPRNNCFKRDTKFVTSEGIRSFNDFEDGDVVEVKDKDGLWRKAVVHFYGKDDMNKVILAANSLNSEKEIVCTANHRWILKDGSVTTNLQVGDQLYLTNDLLAVSFVPKTEDDYRYFAFGFILGDGCDITNRSGVRVRLCAHKNKYVDIFKKAHYKIRAINNSNDIMAINKREFSKQTFLSSCAWKILNKDQKIALIHGYLAADANIRDMMNPNITVCTTDERIRDMLLELAPVAGYHILWSNAEIRSTNYKENVLFYNFKFLVRQANNYNWKVKSITKYRDLECWCIEEPVTHSFMLDGGIVTGNCCLVNLEDMLNNGTVINGIKIESPHRFITASTIATQIITAVSSSQYGGVTVSMTHLAPFVRKSYNKYLKEYLERGLEQKQAEDFARLDTVREVKDGVQTFNYQVNSMSSTNGQAPFITVNLDISETKEYKQELAMIIKEFFNQRIEGMKNEQGVPVTIAFPKLVYVLSEENAVEGSEYWWLTKLAAKCTAKRMVPDYVSKKKMQEYKINRFGNGDCYPPMGCRSFLTPYRTKGNIAKALNYKEDEPKYYGRFNNGVVTISLPDLALSSGGDFDKFWELFEERTELCHKVLKYRLDSLKNLSPEVAPILWKYGAFARLNSDDSIEPLLHDGYSTISLGYAGLYECVKYMTGKSHTDEAEGEAFGLKVMQALNDKCAQWKAAEDVDYSVYGTPIETTTYKFATCLKKRFGKDVFKKIDGTDTDRDFITNSYHVFVEEPIDPFEKIRLEAKFQRLSPGGAISYIETSDLTNNVDAVLEVIKFIYDNIVYAELNTKSDYCQVCGYDHEIKIIEDGKGNLIYECPNCGNRDHNKMNVARRVCGYISTTMPNNGRMDEFRNRYVHLTDTEYKK